MRPFKALNIFPFNQALRIVQWSGSRDTYLHALTRLKTSSTTAKTYRKYIIRLDKELRETRAQVQLRISVFLATYPLVSKISLATRTLLLDPTLFDRPDDLVIAFSIPVSRLREPNYIWRQRKTNIETIVDKVPIKPKHSIKIVPSTTSSLSSLTKNSIPNPK